MRIYTLSFINLIACSAGFQKEGQDATVGSNDDTAEETAQPEAAEPEASEPEASEPEDTDTEDQCADGPEGSTLSTLPVCEYTPSPTGTPFSAKIEWGMSHALIDPSDGITIPAYTFAEEPDMTGTFQAPAIGNLTDDNNDGFFNDKDIPDIAIITGNEFGDDYGVLRLISGRGDVIHDTISWTDYNGVSYAPAIFAGLAVGDIDSDGLYEIVTMVTESDFVTCHPAAYEVSSAGVLQLERVSEEILWCNDSFGYANHSSHAPAFGDIDNDGAVEVLYGDSVYEGADLSLRFSGGAGAAWLNSWFEVGGYWNSGFHSFFYDVDGDGTSLELVAGRTIYNNDGTVYCELDGGSATDGYPAIAEISSAHAGPEIVITGNQDVSLYSTDGGSCALISTLPNSPYGDSSISGYLEAEHPDCNTERSSFGGPPTVADFDGDGSPEIGVSGACWYTIYKNNPSTGLYRYAMAPTRDWSSASTGSTVFDFDGDDQAEIVFSDEEALYVWGIDQNQTNPWNKLVPYLIDENHGSWTIHEYPLVADIDSDGKAEILVLNSPRPAPNNNNIILDQYGIYVLGAADDNWVSARQWWNQHAYFVNNIDDDGTIGVASPNYAPFDSSDLNSFRQQAPGSFGAKAAPNLILQGEDPCQEDCGDFSIWLQVGNEGAFITASAGLALSIYGISGSSYTLLDSKAIPFDVYPGELSDGIQFTISNWSSYDYLEAVIDDPELSTETWGASKECEEEDNTFPIYLDGLCP